MLWYGAKKKSRPVATGSFFGKQGTNNKIVGFEISHQITGARSCFIVHVLPPCSKIVLQSWLMQTK